MHLSLRSAADGRHTGIDTCKYISQVPYKQSVYTHIDPLTSNTKRIRLGLRKKTRTPQFREGSKVDRNGILDLWPPHLWLLLPATFVHRRLAGQAFSQSSIIQLAIRLALHPHAFLFARVQICEEKITRR